MEALQQDGAWRRKNSLWLIWAAIPLVNNIAFFYIGYKAQYKRWTRLGVLYAALTVLVLFWMVYNSIDDPLPYNLSGLGVLLYLVLPISYIVCLISAFIVRTAYLTRLAVLQQRELRPHRLCADGNWRRQNSRWLLWAYIPFLGGFSLLHIGIRANVERWKRGGMLYIAAGSVCLLMIVTQGAAHIGTNYLDYGMISIVLGLFCSALLYVAMLVHSLTLRQPYLEAIAPGWEEAHRMLPCLNDKGWRFRNSLWMFWSLLPFCGGASFLQAGIRARRGRWTVIGLLILAADITMGFLSETMLQYRSSLSDDLDIRGYYYVIVTMLYIGAFIGCTIIRPRYLETVAATYRGDADAAILADLNVSSDQERFRQTIGAQRVAVTQSVNEAEPTQAQMQPVIPQPSPAAKPASARPKAGAAAVKETAGKVKDTVSRAAELLDINAASEQDLLSLPGVSLADAKRALSLRDLHGGFASIDAFISELGIKPHFAVQLFKMATALPKKRKAEQEVRPRRTLDI